MMDSGNSLWALVNGELAIYAICESCKAIMTACQCESAARIPSTVKEDEYSFAPW